MSRSIYLIHGGVENGDQELLEQCSKKAKSSGPWNVPKNAKIGDLVVIYILGHGFYATGTICSEPTPRNPKDWVNKHGSMIQKTKLITPPLSLGIIKSQIPELIWANYPRGMKIISDIKLQKKILALISRRRSKQLTEINIKSISEASFEELRALAIKHSSKKLKKNRRTISYRIGSAAVKRYVLKRADGYCESCEYEAPFISMNGYPYLEPHHTTRKADDGPDHPDHVIALCANCHRRAHLSEDASTFNRSLIQKLKTISKSI